VYAGLSCHRCRRSYSWIGAIVSVIAAAEVAKSPWLVPTPIVDIEVTASLPFDALTLPLKLSWLTQASYC
jgi:hypothetical protein